jgi:predicted Fe-S protein YdhL (DUF1289 family)
MPLAKCGQELPAIPLTTADVPSGAKVRLGTLIQGVYSHHDRPRVLIAVPCDCSGGKHYYDWRGDWPVTAAVRSRQASKCLKHKGKAVWLGLDPARLEDSVARSAEGRARFVEWKARWDAMTTEQKREIWRAHRQAKKARKAPQAKPASEPTTEPSGEPIP